MLTGRSGAAAVDGKMSCAPRSARSTTSTGIPAGIESGIGMPSIVTGSESESAPGGGMSTSTYGVALCGPGGTASTPTNGVGRVVSGGGSGSCPWNSPGLWGTVGSSGGGLGEIAGRAGAVTAGCPMIVRWGLRPAAAAFPAIPGADAALDALAVGFGSRAGLFALREAVRGLSDLNHAGMQNHATAASKSGWRRSAWVVAVGVLGLALALFLGRRLYRSITHPLEAIGRGIAALGRGDLSRRVAYHGGDELGQIAQAVNAMAERLAAEEGSREGKLRTYERLAAAVLDAAEPEGVVFDREGHVVVAGRMVRERLGDDPLATLRQGAGGLLPAGEIDRLMGEVLGQRPSQVPGDEPASRGGVAVTPVLGRAGSVLGALVRVRAPVAAPPGRPGVR